MKITIKYKDGVISEFVAGEIETRGKDIIIGDCQRIIDKKDVAAILIDVHSTKRWVMK